MLPDPKGLVNLVFRDVDYPIPIVVSRVRYWGYGCAKEVLSEMVRQRAVERATAAVRCRVGTAGSVMGNVGVVGSHTSRNSRCTPRIATPHKAKYYCVQSCLEYCTIHNS